MHAVKINGFVYTPKSPDPTLFPDYVLFQIYCYIASFIHNIRRHSSKCYSIKSQLKNQQ